MKLYFTHSFCAVIVLLTSDLYKTSFSTYSFKKPVFRLSVFYVFCLFGFEFDGIFVDFSCTINVYMGTKYCVILFSPKGF